MDLDSRQVEVVRLTNEHIGNASNVDPVLEKASARTDKVTLMAYTNASQPMSSARQAMRATE